MAPESLETRDSYEHPSGVINVSTLTRNFVRLILVARCEIHGIQLARSLKDLEVERTFDWWVLAGDQGGFPKWAPKGPYWTNYDSAHGAGAHCVTIDVADAYPAGTRYDYVGFMHDCDWKEDGVVVPEKYDKQHNRAAWTSLRLDDFDSLPAPLECNCSDRAINASKIVRHNGPQNSDTWYDRWDVIDECGVQLRLNVWIALELDAPVVSTLSSTVSVCFELALGSCDIHAIQLVRDQSDFDNVFNEGSVIWELAGGQDEFDRTYWSSDATTSLTTYCPTIDVSASWDVGTRFEYVAFIHDCETWPEHPTHDVTSTFTRLRLENFDGDTFVPRANVSTGGRHRMVL